MFPLSWKTYLQWFSNIKCLGVTSHPENHKTKINTLCEATSTSTSNLTCSADDEFFCNSSHISSDADHESLPDLATVFASQRFFFSSPGRSNSIVESPNSPPDHPKNALLPPSVAIQTYSPDPLQDFTKSMQQMVEAHGIIHDVKAHWDFLNHLLLCYLTLNPKQTHKFIIKAFSHLLLSLMSSETSRKIQDRQHGTSSPRLV